MIFAQLSKEQAKEEVKGLVDKYNHLFESGKIKSYNEEMAKKVQPEIEALYGVLAKLSEKYKNLMAFALDDFKGHYSLEDADLHKSFINQVFLGWIYTAHFLYGGKTVIQLARQILDLSGNEEKMLLSVENSVIGYFEVMSHAGNEVSVRDMFTGKEYAVKVIELDRKFRKGELIEAKLAKTLDGNLFFFGGFMIRTDEKREIMRDLRTYIR